MQLGKKSVVSFLEDEKVKERYVFGVLNSFCEEHRLSPFKKVGASSAKSSCCEKGVIWRWSKNKKGYRYSKKVCVCPLKTATPDCKSLSDAYLVQEDDESGFKRIVYKICRSLLSKGNCRYAEQSVQQNERFVDGSPKWHFRCVCQLHNLDAEDTHGTGGEVTMSKSEDGHYYIESMKRCCEKKTIP